MKYDVLIVGSGPAGLSAAVYLKRAGFLVGIIEKDPFSGGQILNTHEVENYLGFENIGGFELAEKFRKHAESVGTEFIKGVVTRVEKNFVTLADGAELSARAIVIASGASNKKLGAKGETELAGRGVSYCATCDGAFFRGKSVAVVGGGDTALEDTIYLSKICESVTVIHRRDSFRAAGILQDKLAQTPNITTRLNDEVIEFIGGQKLSSLKLKNGEELAADGAFIAIGQSPNSSFLAEYIAKDGGYIVAGEDCRTNTDGIYAVGDVRTKSCRQIVTAVADGASVSRSVSEDIG